MATAKRTTDKLIGWVEGTWNEYTKFTAIHKLMTQVTDCAPLFRVATVNINGKVILAVEHDGFVAEYDITEGATK